MKLTIPRNFANGLGPLLALVALGCSGGTGRTPSGGFPPALDAAAGSTPAGDAGIETSDGGVHTPAQGDAGSRDAAPPEADAAAKDAGVSPKPDAATTDAGATALDAGGPIDAGSAKGRVLAFLSSTSGQKVAIGIEDKDATNPEADSNTMSGMAGGGRHPSFWSGDFGFGAGAVAARPTITAEGIKQWKSGAVVQYIYHACPLSMDENCQWDDLKGSYGDLTDAQWKDLTTPGGQLYKTWTSRLDTIAVFLQQLKDAGIAPLFRPLHEINGAWAWWQGRPGPTGSLLLYQLTHDYLVNTKGLTNIIWVWNVQDYTTLAADVAVYSPGAAYFDVAALDVYNTGYTDGNYKAMLGAAAGRPIGIAECQYLPSSQLLASQPLWAYVAMWPDFFSDNTTLIPELFGDSRVLSLSQMPGW